MDIERVDFSKIQNRNEKRIKKILQDMVHKKDPKLASFNEKDICDVYALALNALPPRYVQHGTIVVQESVSEKELSLAIDDAIDITRNYPKV